MGTFFQAAAAVLIASVLGVTLSRQNKELSSLLTIGVCCMVMFAAVSFLKPVLDLLHQLESVGNLNSDLVRILLKVVGIGLVTEIAGMICTDAGNASMGKALQMLSSAVILWISIPAFEALLDLIQQILGGI